MNAYEKIRAALEQAYKERHEPCSVELRIDEALAALAELERAAATPRLWLAEPVSGDYAGYENDIVSAAAPEWAIKRAQRCYYAEFRAVPLYTVPPPAPVAEIRKVVVTDEMCDRAYIGKWRGVPELIGHEPDDEDRQWAREWLEAWRAELGPALGLVEIREPTPEECVRMENQFTLMTMRLDTSGGRDMFDSVRAVMWPKSEAK